MTQFLKAKIIDPFTGLPSIITFADQAFIDQQLQLALANKVTSITGTANQIIVTGTIIDPILSLSDTLILPGTLTTNGDLTVNSTGYIKIAVGTTLQRSSLPNVGEMRFNTNLGQVEIYNGTSWIGLGGGGTISLVDIAGSTGLTVTGSPITTSGTINLTLGTELQALSTLIQTGLITRTGSNTYTGRILIADTGINITNGDGISGNPIIGLSNTGVTSGTYSYPSSFTVNAKGQLTNITSGSIPINNLTLTGDITGSGSLSNPVTTTFKQNPVFTGTGSMTIPVGTTSQRPTIPTLGMMRFNNDPDLMPVFWLDASVASSLTLSGSLVTNWQSISSIGSDSVSQSNTSFCPILVTNALNGKNVVSFNGSNQYLFKQPVPAYFPIGNSVRTVFVVLTNAQNTGVVYQHVFHYGTAYGNGTYGFCAYAGGAYFGNHYWANNFLTSVPISSSSMVFQSVFNGSTDSFYKNGTSVGQKTVTLNTGTDWLTVGCRISPAEYGKVYLAELRIYNTVLSSTDSAIITSELMSKWGIT